MFGGGLQIVNTRPRVAVCTRIHVLYSCTRGIGDVREEQGIYLSILRAYRVMYDVFVCTDVFFIGFAISVLSLSYVYYKMYHSCVTVHDCEEIKKLLPYAYNVCIVFLYLASAQECMVHGPTISVQL